ncbi:hypothetical protein TNCV_292091 [Trichonephila clavipes]|nr:hypothetical protein TNCV_292091 [Trichonephila clavipes]
MWKRRSTSQEIDGSCYYAIQESYREAWGKKKPPGGLTASLGITGIQSGMVIVPLELPSSKGWAGLGQIEDKRLAICDVNLGNGSISAYYGVHSNINDSFTHES